VNVAPAVHEAREGVVLDVELVPGASRDAFPDGYNEWRKRVMARVAAPAEEGRANEALVALVAQFFDVPRARVRVAHGAASRQKGVVIEGLSAAAVRDRLAAALK
jgi:hypothetical protein